MKAVRRKRIRLFFVLIFENRTSALITTAPRPGAEFCITFMFFGLKILAKTLNFPMNRKLIYNDKNLTDKHLKQ